MTKKVSRASRKGWSQWYAPCIHNTGATLFLSRFLSVCALLSTMIDARSEGLAKSRTRFFYSNFDGSVGSARIMRHYWVPVVHPDAPVDSRLDPRLRKAATIAQERANARSKFRCWQ